MADNPDSTLVVTFGIESVKNNAKSLKEGRPIYEDREICTIRSPGDKQSEKVFPAHARSRWVTNIDGEQTEQTYAERFNAQYMRFKEGRQQVQDGTPLEEVPFLTQAKRAELRALHVYTVEQLADLDGPNLKNLGMNGRELKNQAIAYIDNASGSAAVVRQAAEIEELKRQIAELRGGSEPERPDAPTNQQSAFADMGDDDLKAFIKDKAGAAPRGNPSHDTLVRMAGELSAGQAA